MPTPRGGEADRIAGSDSDDYVVKPFSLRELGGARRGASRSAPARRRQRETADLLP
jgi:DNA-binding response OmpR family regulator